MAKTDLSRMKPAALARSLGVNQSSIGRAHNVGRLVIEGGVIDLFHPTNYAYLTRRTLVKTEKRPECRAKASALLRRIDKAGIPIASDIDDIEVPPVATIPAPHTPGGREIRERAATAELESVIKKSEILAEKLEQERLTTAERMKHLGPIGLLKYAYTFPLAAMNRCYRAVDETMPMVEAHVRADKSRDAAKVLKNRLEMEFKQAIKEMTAMIEDEGFHPEAAAEEGRRLGNKLIKDGKK
ncbi:MAG: hypothetical protein AB2L13_10595 [Spirochaetota bacterium]